PGRVRQPVANVDAGLAVTAEGAARRQQPVAGDVAARLHGPERLRQRVAGGAPPGGVGGEQFGGRRAARPETEDEPTRPRRGGGRGLGGGDSAGNGPCSASRAVSATRPKPPPARARKSRRVGGSSGTAVGPGQRDILVASSKLHSAVSVSRSSARNGNEEVHP